MSTQKSNLPICLECDGVCCRDLAMPTTRPRTRYEIDLMKWYLHFDTVNVFIRDHRWFILILGSRCMYLNDKNLCDKYDERMDVCREHNPPECEMNGDFYDVMMTVPEDLDAYLNKSKKSKKKKRQKNKA